MKIKNIILSASLCLISISGFSQVNVPQFPANRPNIIIILVDDQGYGGVSCYPHNKNVSTPNIDILASEGVKFTQGYTSGNVCSPTRAGILTGKYQQSFGFYGLEDPAVGGIPANEKIISEYLKENGYNTAAIGKWHVGDQIRNHPNNRGFDYFYGFIDGLHDYFNPIVGGSWSGWYNGLAFTLENNNPVVDMKYSTYEYTDRAINFIEQNVDHPFFLYVPYNAIHSPLQAPEDILKKTAKDPTHATRDEVVYAMTSAMDNSVGRIISTLEKKGIRDNTLVFYLSDNGGVESGDNWNLRGKKGGYYEGGIRVPFIASWPGRIPKGKVINDPVITIDLSPTILSAANIQQQHMQGVDLFPYLTGKKNGPPHDVLYWSIEKASDRDVGENNFAVRQGKWKLVSDSHVVKDYNLYNIDEDPFEKNGLKDKQPEKYQELFSLYLKWINKMPEGLTKNGTQRESGVEMMRKYERNYKKTKGNATRVRIVNTAAGNGKEQGGEPQ